MTEQLPIATLILARAAELGFRPGDIARRIGFTNIAKGLRRLDAVCAGDLGPRTKFVIDGLPAALDLTPDQVRLAIEATMDELAELERMRVEEDERLYRARFVPHLIIVPIRQRPQPLFVVALIGAERILRRDFDLTQGPDTFLEQALVLVPTSVVAFGEVAGFTVNYTPDHAVQFDLEGNMVATFPRARRPGFADVTLKGDNRSILPLFGAELSKD